MPSNQRHAVCISAMVHCFSNDQVNDMKHSQTFRYSMITAVIAFTGWAHAAPAGHFTQHAFNAAAASIGGTLTTAIQTFDSLPAGSIEGQTLGSITYSSALTPYLALTHDLGVAEVDSASGQQSMVSRRTSDGNSELFGYEDQITFDFTSAVSAFGFWLIPAVQNLLADEFTLTAGGFSLTTTDMTDGNYVQIGGKDALWVGIVDTTGSFTQATLTFNDTIGIGHIDDVTTVARATVTPPGQPVSEPASLALAALALLGAAAASRRKA